MTDLLHVFTDLTDDAALLSLEHQVHLEEVLGEHNWQVELSKPEFSFTGATPRTCTRMHLLGSAAPGPRSWLWAWANPSGFHPEASRLSESLRDWGRRHDLALFAEPEVPFAELPGQPDEPHLAATFFIEAAKTLTGVWTHYNAPAGGGTRGGFLIEHPDFELPEPEPARVMRILQQGLAEIPLTNHRRAFYSYAVRRGMSAVFSDDRETLTITGPRFTAHVAFDDLGRVKDLQARLGAATG
ncbi:DUF6882 domain-containing protein [Virgisporangium ochraceum]|uniref:DUF6882 domain-containing protein n=1 Tax=Virgisporangium ochraceum TaxID=65505 RepID=UPI001943DB43|nr:DUF6882 domain-containing protein [Virgisporangium ochraceum]